MRRTISVVAMTLIIIVDNDIDSMNDPGYKEKTGQ